MSTTIKQIEERRADAVKRAEEASQKEWTAEVKAEYEGAIKEAEMLNEQVEAQKKVLNLAHLNQAGKPLNEKEERQIQNYSFVKAFREASSGGGLTGFEAEMNQEAQNAARDAGITLKNLAIPQAVLQSQFRNDVTTSTAGDTIATELSSSFIDIFYSKLKLKELGATSFNNLQGNVDFPKMVEDTTAITVKAENAAADENSPTASKISLAPQRLPVFVEVSGQLLKQTSVSVEAWIRNYLAYRIAKNIDSAGITKITGTAGIGSVVGGTNGAAPTWGNMIDLETEIAIDDADVANMGYFTNPKVRGKLKQTEKFSSTGQVVWNDNMVNGYKTAVSTQVPSDLTKGTSSGVASAIIFGNYADLYFGQWGGIDFLVNPYSRDTEDLVRINAGTFYDVEVARAQSFAAMLDALTA